MTATEPPPLPQTRLEKPMARARRREPTAPALILLYFVGVFAGAALIAPRLYESAQFLESIHHWSSFLAEQPFHRFVSRCLIVLGILGLPMLFRALRVHAGMLGLKMSARRWVEAMLGFGWGFVSLAVLAALLVTFEARTLDLDHSRAEWMRHLKNATLAAVAVALVEEILFRGALFGSLRRGHGFVVAAIWSSAIYALLHFLEKPEFVGRVEWTSGFEVLGGMLGGLWNWKAMVPAFLNLTLVGVMLALVFERTGSLFFAMGLHAGFVFFLKSLGFLTNEVAGVRNGFWGTDKITDGWMTTAVLIVTLVLIERTWPPRKAEER